ncbi:MAG: ABC transporter ATP-binding protein [Treponema sp.]|nr:ABC transporter ATP-binding protein [Treponema sp.]
MNELNYESIFCKGLTAKYSDKLVLNNIDFKLSRGDFTCICGPNGTGKSTLLEILANVQDDTLFVQAQEMPFIKNPQKKPDEKTYIYTMNHKSSAQKIAIMEQKEFSVWNFSVKELILQGRYPYTNNGFYKKDDYGLVENIISELGLNDLAEKKCHAISGGEYQKVMIARALVQEPAFLLLDEPTANLDFVYEQSFLQFLHKLSKEKNIGIAMTIHNINLASIFADYIALLPPKKQIIFGTPELVFTKENLEATYGQSVEIYRHPLTNKLQAFVKNNP